MKQFRALSMLLLCSTLLTSGCGMVSDFLRGSDNTTQPTELTDIEQAISISVIWDKQVSSGTGGGFIKLFPAASQGRVYVAGYEGDVTALDATNGNVIWSVDTELPISAGVGLDENRLFVGTSEGQLLALNSSDGAEVWRAQVSSEILATPRAADGIVVVRAIDGSFTGFDVRTGTRLWVYNYTVPVLSLRGLAPPLLAQGAAIAGLDTGKLLVLSLANGAPIWEKTIAPPRGRTELDRMVDIDSEPRIVDNTLFTTAYQGTITAIDLRNGNTLWNRDFSSHSGLNADNRRVYINDTDDAIWALDQSNGGSLWKQSQLIGRKLSAPVLSGSHVVVGDFEGYLHWINRIDGKIEGRVRVDSDGITTPPTVQDGILYVLSNGGALSALRTDN